MKVYVDVFSGDEIVSDSFKMNNLFDGVGVEIESSYIIKGEIKVDIGCRDEVEEPGDVPADEKVLDVIDAFRYQETSFDKASYKTYIMGYMKKVKGHLETTKKERVEGFMKGAKEMVDWIFKNFGDFTFYTPESYDMDNSIILSYFKGEAITPTFVYFLDGLKGVTV